MVLALAPMSALIEERRIRLSYLLAVLNSHDIDKAPVEVLFNRVIANSERHYVADAWGLFRADLDFLEDHDCLVIRDNHVFVTLPLEPMGS